MVTYKLFLKMKPISIIFLIFAFSIRSSLTYTHEDIVKSSVHTTPHGSGSINDTCSDDSECNSDQYLICGWEKICLCNNGWYTDGTCKLLINEGCYQGGQECISSGVCNVGSCECPPSRGPSSDRRTCLIGFGGACEVTNDECNYEKLFLCGEDSRCACHEDSWHDNNDRCLIKANAECKIGPDEQYCGSHSTCTAVGGKFLCICNDGMEGDLNGQCRIPYGADCSWDSWNCDETKFQGCESSEQICKCNGEGSSTWYDSVARKCLILANGYCNTNENAQSCVANSECNDNGQCMCVEPFYPNKENMCKLKYGAACETTNDLCNFEEYQICDSATLTCDCQDPKNTWFDGYECKILIGGECGVDSAPCSGNSECFMENGISTCRCLQGSEPSNDGRSCAVGYGGKCDKDECSSEKYLTCSGYKCTCFSEAYWYNVKTDRCELFIGEYCETSPGSHACSESSICDPYTNTCACPDGFTVSPSKQNCIEDIGEGSSCSTSENCNPEKFLICKDGVCSCKENSWYNPRTKTCELTAGQTCNPANPDSQRCTEFSYCESSRDGSFKCVCMEGFIESENGKCVASYGAPCGEFGYAECNEDEFLVCFSGKCDCNSNSWFNPHTASCQLLAGRNCDSGNQQCTDYSSCQLSGNGVKECQCEVGYVPSINGRCYIGYEGDCKGSDEDCLHDDFLICENKKCVCNFNAWYNTDTATCELFAGEYCTPGSGQQACIEFSSCGREGSGGYKCLCSDGFRQSAEGRCVHKSCGYGNSVSFFAPKRSNRRANP